MDKMPVGERIRLGKKRRKQQLSNYEKNYRRESNQKPEPTRVKRLKFTTDVTLLEIASREDMNEMQYLLKAGANPNMANHDGLTAMHQCCIDGSMELVTLLLKFGANVNLTDRDLWTPLHAAATCGHLQITQMLIKAGANLTAVNGDGDMPYDITEDEETLQYLENEMIKRGITQDSIEKARTSFHDKMIHDVENLIKTKSFLDVPQDQGGTLIHVAISNGFEDIAEVLIKNGASLTAEDEDGWQPIHVAAFWGMGQIVELLTREYSVNLRARTHLGETPYELCDDLDLRGLILDILNENPIETDDDSQEFEEEINLTLKTENEENSESKTEDTLTFVSKDKIESQNSDEESTSEENKDKENLISLASRETDTEVEMKTHPIVNDHSNERMVADRRGSMKEIKLNASFRTRSNSDLTKRIKSISQNRIIDEGNNSDNEKSNMESYEISQKEASNAGEHTVNEEFYDNETNIKEHLIPISNEIDTENSFTNLQTVEGISVAYSESITSKMHLEETQSKTEIFQVIQNDIFSSQIVQSEDSDDKNYELTQNSEDMATTIDKENEKYKSSVKNFNKTYDESLSLYEDVVLNDTQEEKDEIPNINKNPLNNESDSESDDEYKDVVLNDTQEEKDEIPTLYEDDVLNDTQEKDVIPIINKNPLNNESDSESDDENYENVERNDNIYENESNIERNDNIYETESNNNHLNTQKTQQDLSQPNKISNETNEINISELRPLPTPPTTNTSPVILRNKSTTESFNSKPFSNNATIVDSNKPNQKSSDITTTLEAKKNKPSLPEGIQRNSLLYIKWQRQQNRLSRTNESIKEPTINDFSNSNGYSQTIFQPPMTTHRYKMTPSEFVGKKKKKKDNFVKKQKGCVIM